MKYKYLVYDLGHIMFFVLFKLFFRYKVIGGGNIPKKGPVIFASNHGSFLDPPLIGAGIWRRVNYAAREDLFGNWWKSFILKEWGSIPISRDRLDKATLKSILAPLKRGEILTIFPEGTRSPDENLGPAKPGIGMIVSLAKCPVIPVYINGSWRTLGKVHKKLRMMPISVIFGEPIVFEKTEGESGHDMYQRITDEIMAGIEKLKKGV